MFAMTKKDIMLVFERAGRKAESLVTSSGMYIVGKGDARNTSVFIEIGYRLTFLLFPGSAHTTQCIAILYIVIRVEGKFSTSGLRPIFCILSHVLSHEHTRLFPGLGE
jgi:hypothetical protein